MPRNNIDISISEGLRMRFVQAAEILISEGRVSNKAEFARQVGISGGFTNILRYTSSIKSEPSARNIILLEQLGISLKWLFHGEGNPINQS